MTVGPVTKPLALAQCQKCKAYVFSAVTAGVNTAVDPKPLKSKEEFREALITGRSLYRASFIGGKPHKLEYVLPQRVVDLVASGRAAYVSHSCMSAGVVGTDVVEVIPEGPQQAPVTPGRVKGGSHHPPAPVDGSQGPPNKITTPAFSDSSRSAVGRATRRPSRCVLCKKPIWGNEPNIVAIEYQERVVYAYHVDD